MNDFSNNNASPAALLLVAVGAVASALALALLLAEQTSEPTPQRLERVVVTGQRSVPEQLPRVVVESRRVDGLALSQAEPASRPE